MDDLPVLHDEGLIAWVAEHTTLSRTTIVSVLAVEQEFMAAVGILTGPEPYPFHFYDPEDLIGEQREVDTLRLAQDAERFLGVSVEDAHAVFGAECEYLQHRGLA